MSAFRLQTFSPRPPPSAQPNHPVLTEADLERVRDAAYREGFLAAQTEITAAFRDDETRLASDLVEALNDARLTNEAARRHVMNGLAPTVAALCGAISPALAAAGFGAEIAARVERALFAAPDARPRLRCAPELVATLEALLAERGLSATIEAAPGLSTREAELYWDEGFDKIDLDACVAEVGACLASHLARPADTADHDNEGDDHG